MVNRFALVLALAVGACAAEPPRDSASDPAAGVPVSGGGRAALVTPPPPESDAPVAVEAPVPLSGAPARDFLRVGDAFAIVRVDGALDLVFAADGGLVFAADGGLVGADGRAQRIDDGAIPGLSASADARRLAWARRADGPETDVFVMDLAGGAPARVTDWAGSEDGPALSPDGARVAFVSGRTGVASIWIAPARDGGGAAAVQATNADVSRPRVAGAAPPGFVLPPDAGTLRWDGDALAWQAGGRAWRVEAPR